MSSAKGKIYDRAETLKSVFSNHYEIHSFGYGLLGWLLSNAVPSVEPVAKAAILGVVATVYGYHGATDYLGLELSTKNLPVDIRRQKHYFVLGVAAAFMLEKLVSHILPLLL